MGRGEGTHPDGFDPGGRRVVRSWKVSRPKVERGYAPPGEVGDGPGVLAAGFDALFPKPVNWPRLRDLVRRLLGVEGRGRPPV